MELTTSAELCQEKLQFAGTTKDDPNTHLSGYVPALTLRHDFMSEFCLHGISSCLPWSEIVSRFILNSSDKQPASNTTPQGRWMPMFSAAIVSRVILSRTMNCYVLVQEHLAARNIPPSLHPPSCKCIVILSQAHSSLDSLGKRAAITNDKSATQFIIHWKVAWTHSSA